MTGQASSDGMERGADDYLAKPFTNEELLATVGARLRKQSTQRRQAEKPHALLIDILETTTDFVASATPQGQLIYLNRAGRRLVGLGEDADLEGVDLWRFSDDSARRTLQTQALPAARQTGVWTGETTLIGADGQPVCVSQVIVAHKSADGELQYFSTVMRDLTERKIAEEKLRELAGSLLRLQDEERRRVGRELHDSTGQTLAALEINLDLLNTSATGLDDKARTLVNQSLALANQCSSQIRTMSYLLHPPLLDELGLVSAVRWYLDGFGERSGIRVELDAPETAGRLPAEAELALFRIVQESLTNIHRHSGSKSAGVRLTVSDATILLEVIDEGCGIPDETLAKIKGGAGRLGVGLSGMRERVRQLGGNWRIDSNAAGTHIEARLPLKPHNP
jgi:PAS domain S-box-containing protein